MFIYFFLLLVFVLIISDDYILHILSQFNFNDDNIYLEYYKKILNIIVVNYNKMSLMLKPKFQIASYNCIYYFSLGQIKYNKYLAPYVNRFFDSILSFIGYDENTEISSDLIYSFYKNGNFIISYAVKEDMCIKIVEPNEYDLLTVSKYDKNNDKFNDICSDKMMVDCEFIESDIKFLNIMLTCGELQFEIKLNGSEYVNYNYYIVGNVINSSFFKYYLNNKMSVKDMDIDYDNFKYTVRLIDHNVCLVELDETQSMVIKKNNYEIVKLSNNDEKYSNQEVKSDGLSDSFEDDFDKLE